MRGNDLIRATSDVLVCDTLTGNLLIKLFSAGLSGGEMETMGSGYGIGLGPDQKRSLALFRVPAARRPFPVHSVFALRWQETI